MDNIHCFETELGWIKITECGGAITELNLTKEPQETNVLITPLLKDAEKQLKEYLNGQRRVFQLPLSPKGTDYQKKVWEALRLIPYGTTNTYKDIATKIGNPKACRAIGLANNKNPILILIPCHRVIGSSGSLVGFAAGLDIKEKLLHLEKQNSNNFIHN